MITKSAPVSAARRSVVSTTRVSKPWCATSLRVASATGASLSGLTSIRHNSALRSAGKLSRSPMSRNGKTKPPAPMMAIFVVEVMVAAYGAGRLRASAPLGSQGPSLAGLSPVRDLALTRVYIAPPSSPYQFGGHLQLNAILLPIQRTEAIRLVVALSRAKKAHGVRFCMAASGHLVAAPLVIDYAALPHKFKGP